VGRNPKRRAKWQCRTQVPADRRGTRDPQLAVEPLDQIPDLPALIGAWRIQALRAVRALRLAGLAVLCAPAELPLGKGGEAFFSASKIMTRATYLV